jgi:hypothetical protein
LMPLHVPESTGPWLYFCTAGERDLSQWDNSTQSGAVHILRRPFGRTGDFAPCGHWFVSSELMRADLAGAGHFDPWPTHLRGVDSGCGRLPGSN